MYKIFGYQNSYKFGAFLYFAWGPHPPSPPRTWKGVSLNSYFSSAWGEGVSLTLWDPTLTMQAVSNLYLT